MSNAAVSFVHERPESASVARRCPSWRGCRSTKCASVYHARKSSNDDRAALRRRVHRLEGERELGLAERLAEVRVELAELVAC